MNKHLHNTQPREMRHEMRQLVLDWDSPAPSVDTPNAPDVPNASDALGQVLVPAPVLPLASVGTTESAAEGAESASAHVPQGHLDENRITALPAWQHPQANRHIVLNSHALGYWLQRRRRRTVGMKIAAQGLEVHAPAWVNIAEIERILQTKSGWIVGKLREQAAMQHSQQLTQPQWQDGQYLPWRGGLLQVRLNGQQATQTAPSLSAKRLQKLATAAKLLATQVNEIDCSKTPVATHVLHLDLPINSATAAIRDCTAYWMQQQAYAIFTERLAHYAPLLDVRWSALKLSQADTRWGSASSSGIIRLHWRLIQMPANILDYVVVHELAHLREMNHSPRFWALVEQILPDYQQSRYQLKRTVLAPW